MMEWIEARAIPEWWWYAVSSSAVAFLCCFLCLVRDFTLASICGDPVQPRTSVDQSFLRKCVGFGTLLSQGARKLKLSMPLPQ